jgi:hypothetical protein
MINKFVEGSFEEKREKLSKEKYGKEGCQGPACKDDRIHHHEMMMMMTIQPMPAVTKQSVIVLCHNQS